MTTKSSQKTIGSSQAADDLTYGDWIGILTQAFETPGQDDYKSKAELTELTKAKLTNYMLEKRLRVLLLEGRVEAAKRLRPGPSGLMQRVFVYRLRRHKAE